MYNQVDKYDLTNKVSLITGAAGLLGRQHSYALAIKGSIVIMTDTNSDLLEKARDDIASITSSDNIHSFIMDVTEENSVIDIKKKLAEQSMIVSILVNNAAVDPKMKTFKDKGHGRLESFSIEEWNRQINVGLTGAFICSKIFGTEMAAQNNGVILNISSDLSIFSPDQRIYEQAGLNSDQQPKKPVTYPVIKTGLIGLTRYLATYWADKNIRANALSPGGVYSGQNRVFVDKLQELIPLGRMANEDEYIEAVQFLCSDASAYMNGQNIVMDGGRSIW